MIGGEFVIGALVLSGVQPGPDGMEKILEVEAKAPPNT